MALDCEFVGVGPNGEGDALARVSLINFHGDVILDQYVKPQEAVTDYRTAVSGVKPGHIHGRNARPFKQVQRQVAELIKERILVGHAVHNDLQVLLLSHPKHLLRDTSKFKGLCPDGRPRSLKNLALEVLGMQIQRGEHNSVEDARATLALYKKCRVEWEKHLFDAQHHRKHHAPGSTGGAVAATSPAAAAASHAAAGAAIAASVAAASVASSSSLTPRRRSAASRAAASEATAHAIAASKRPALALEASIAARRAERETRNAERNQRRNNKRKELKRAEREG